MFRILIVEDILDTLDIIAEVLRDEFETAIIECASTTTEAKEYIRQAIVDQEPYDAVILDFMLPDNLGANPEMDESICRLLCEEMEEALIVHITAFAVANEVRKHIEEFHYMDPSEPRAVIISKARTDYCDELVEILAKFLYSDLISTKVKNFSIEYAPRQSRSSSPALASGTRSMTYPLAELERDIGLYWDKLDFRLQKRIQLKFDVDTSGEAPFVRLKLFNRDTNLK